MSPIALFDCRVDAAGLSAAQSVLAGGALASGPNVARLEQRLALTVGRPHVVALSDLTHALTLALKLAGVRPGDDVLTLAYNCLSSNAAIVRAGAVPVWVDIDPAQACISLADCAAAITERTRALVVYHVAGYPAPLDELRRFCDERRITLIEDANNALGARWAGRDVGSVGDYGVFSFYANRQVNAIDGAALICPDEALADEARRMRRFGIDAQHFRDPLGEIDASADVPRIGGSSTLNHVNATLALQHMDSLDRRLARCRENVRRLGDALRGTPGIEPVRWSDRSEPVFWTWLLRCERRDALMATLKRRGVQCSKLHQPNDVYSGFGARPRNLPGTADFMREVLALPCGWWLADADLDRLVAEVRHAGAL